MGHTVIIFHFEESPMTNLRGHSSRSDTSSSPFPHKTLIRVVHVKRHLGTNIPLPVVSSEAISV